MIELERRLELAFEGDRWADLNRLGNAIAVKAIRDRVGQALFPIPLRDTRTSPKLTQNQVIKRISRIRRTTS